jgi:hypothetical protein
MTDDDLPAVVQSEPVRTVDTEFTDVGPHPPLPCPDDPQAARIAELERLVASLVWCDASSQLGSLGFMDHECRVRFARECIDEQDWHNDENKSLGAEWLAAVRVALESPNSGEPREGDK